MKDYLIGLLSGILITFGWLLWFGGTRILGIIFIILAWFLSVIVFGHYQYVKTHK